MGKKTKKQHIESLKKIGIDYNALVKEVKKNKDTYTKLEEGKNKHRVFVQESKNQEILNEISKNPSSDLIHPVFFYRGIETPQYNSLQSFLMDRKWEDSEKKD